MSNTYESSSHRRMLTDAERTRILFLREEYKLTAKAIATRMGLSVNVVYSVFSRKKKEKRAN